MNDGLRDEGDPREQGDPGELADAQASDPRNDADAPHPFEPGLATVETTDPVKS